MFISNWDTTLLETSTELVDATTKFLIGEASRAETIPHLQKAALALQKLVNEASSCETTTPSAEASSIISMLKLLDDIGEVRP